MLGGCRGSGGKWGRGMGSLRVRVVGCGRVGLGRGRGSRKVGLQMRPRPAGWRLRRLGRCRRLRTATRRLCAVFYPSSAGFGTIPVDNESGLINNCLS